MFNHLINIHWDKWKVGYLVNSIQKGTLLSLAYSLYTNSECNRMKDKLMYLFIQEYLIFDVYNIHTGSNEYTNVFQQIKINTYLSMNKQYMKGVHAMKCGIVRSEFELSHTITFTFGQIPLEKVWTPYPPSYGLNSTPTALLERCFDIK